MAHERQQYRCERFQTPTTVLYRTEKARFTLKPEAGSVHEAPRRLAGEWQLECHRADGAKLKLSAHGQLPAIDLLRRFLS